LPRQWIGREAFAGAGHDRSLPHRAVTLPTAILDKCRLAMFDRRSRSGVRCGTQANNQSHCNHVHAHAAPHRGCVTTSTSAGSPAFTTCTAFLSAGSSSFRTVIVPVDLMLSGLAGLA